MLFRQIKSQVTTRQAAEHYGLTVKHNGMTHCIFHNDRHPSMKVDERFYCFSCHASGDVINWNEAWLASQNTLPQYPHSRFSGIPKEYLFRRILLCYQSF